MNRVLITGACGFIGSCLCRRLLAEGHEVVGIDNMSRKGVEFNARELTPLPGFHLVRGDLVDFAATESLFQSRGPFSAVFHLAGQVAVTSSYQDRLGDFQNNARSGFNVVENVRRHSPDAYCLYSSTNKVYVHLVVNEPVGLDATLQPYTPYGVSKAVADLYFLEYGRQELGLQTCILRQSCIYGHHQYGVEDLGWLAWFAIANILGRPVTIYGDGHQVRDLLFVDDLVDLYLECWSKKLTGAFPVGGGAGNAICIDSALKLICEKTGKQFKSITHGPTRPGDQPYFVADLRWATSKTLSWKPRVQLHEGMSKMITWIYENRELIEQVISK